MLRLPKNQHIPTLIVFIAFIFGMTMFGLVRTDDDTSEYERRELGDYPSVSFDRVIDGKFSDDYSVYLQDQTPLRDDFRFLKSFVSRNLFLNPENNGVFVVDGSIIDKFGRINEGFINRAAELIGDISREISSDRQFIALIPTKGQRLVDSKYLVADQSEIIERFDEIEGVVPIDLSGLIELVGGDAYYKTDPHWNIDGVMWSYREIADQLGFDPATSYEFEIFEDDFIGGEYGKAAAWGLDSDEIVLPRNDVIDAMSSCRYITLEDTDCVDSVFYRGEESVLDPYDVFLGGLGPIIEVTNPAVSTGEELVVFKDSYAHAIAPLLAQHFSKVTLFDLRYIRRAAVMENFDLSDKTVLYLYSTPVLNTDPQIVN